MSFASRTYIRKVSVDLIYHHHALRLIQCLTSQLICQGPFRKVPVDFDKSSSFAMLCFSFEIIYLSWCVRVTFGKRLLTRHVFVMPRFWFDVICIICFVMVPFGNCLLTWYVMLCFGFDTIYLSWCVNEPSFRKMPVNLSRLHRVLLLIWCHSSQLMYQPPSLRKVAVA